MESFLPQCTSVQRDMVRLRETKGDMLCLYGPGSPTRRSYRAVIEVAPINLSLKAEDEQEAIIERHVYVIIPASQSTGGSWRRSGFPMLFGKRRAQRMAETEELARQELALRAEALTQQLASCSLTCHRLHNTELALLMYRCLTPELPSHIPSQKGFCLRWDATHV